MKLKYLNFILKLIYLKIKYPFKLRINSLKIGLEKGVKIILKDARSKIVFNNMVYIMRNGNIEVYRRWSYRYWQ